jgi:hypothetical protein
MLEHDLEPGHEVELATVLTLMADRLREALAASSEPQPVLQALADGCQAAAGEERQRR